MKEAAFKELVASVRQAGRIRRGARKPSRTFTFRPADVKTVRVKLGKSQSEFAPMIGVSVATLRNWEQGRRVPEASARTAARRVPQSARGCGRVATRRSLTNA